MIKEVLSPHRYIIQCQLPLIHGDQSLPKTIQLIEHLGDYTVIVSAVEGLHADLLNFVEEEVH